MKQAVAADVEKWGDDDGGQNAAREAWDADRRTVWRLEKELEAAKEAVDGTSMGLDVARRHAEAAAWRRRRVRDLERDVRAKEERAAKRARGAGV